MPGEICISTFFQVRHNIWVVIFLLIWGCNTLEGNLQKLESSQSAERAEGIYWLAQYSEKQNAKQLVEASLTREPNRPLVRSLAARLMGVQGDRTVIPLLLAALDDHHYLVRLEAAQSLATLQAREAVPVLMQKVGQEPYIWVRLRMVQSLLLLKDPSCVPALIPLLTDEEPAVRLKAYRALRELTGQKLLPEKEEWERWWATQKT